MPEGVQPEVASLANDCWHKDPILRPSFPAIIERLSKLKHILPPDMHDFEAVSWATSATSLQSLEKTASQQVTQSSSGTGPSSSFQGPLPPATETNPFIM